MDGRSKTSGRNSERTICMNKYHAKKVTVDGIKFDSRKEANRYCELKLLQRAGKITGLQRQVRYLLVPTQYDKDGKCIYYSANYVADFVYHQNGDLVVEDVKGYRTPEYILKKKLMLERYGIIIKEV